MEEVWGGLSGRIRYLPSSTGRPVRSSRLARRKVSTRLRNSTLRLQRLAASEARAPRPAWEALAWAPRPWQGEALASPRAFARQPSDLLFKEPYIYPDRKSDV